MSDPFRENVPTTGVLPRAGNPFRPGAGKVPPSFGGRMRPLLVAKTIVDRLAVPSDPVDAPVIRGFRGLGKTALMAYTREHAAAAGVVTLHIEADPSDATLVTTCASLARDARELTTDVPAAIARRLAALDVRGRVEFHPGSTSEPGANIEALLHDLVLLGANRGRGILLTVDEAHEAEELLLRPLIRSLHRHAQDSRALGVLVSGLPGVAETLMDEGQTYSERLLTLDLGLLDRDGTEEALAVPFKQDAGLRVEDDAIEAVHTDSGGYPWFVQLWGAHVWNTLQRHGPIDRAAVEVARVHVAADTDGFYARRWARVPDGRARDLVRALAAREGGGAVGELVSDIGLQRAEQIGQARADLIGRGLVFAPSRGRLAFTVPGFDRWVLAHA